MLLENTINSSKESPIQKQNHQNFLESVFPCCFFQRGDLKQQNSGFSYILTGLTTRTHESSQSQLHNHPMHKNHELIKILNLNSIVSNRSGDLNNLGLQNSPISTILLSKQIIYQGRVMRNSAHDTNGLIVYPDGSYYKGNIKNGVIQGKGAYYFADQSFSYEGQWVNGLPNGFGKQIGPTGIYEGLFRNAKKWGNGKMTFANGSIYMGCFQNNQICGNGTLYSQNSMAKGNWINGFLEGVGLQKYNDNSQYIGQFHKGKPDGQGAFTLPNGKVYVGKFKNGKPIGIGKFYLNNRQYPQNWDKQELLSISVSVQNTISNSGVLMGSINAPSNTNPKKMKSRLMFGNEVANNEGQCTMIRNPSNFSKASNKRSISHRHQ